MADRVRAGQTVYLRADAVGMQGQTVHLQVWEDDGAGDDAVATLPITISAEGFGTAAWAATWQGDDAGAPFNRYYLAYNCGPASCELYSDPGQPATGHFVVQPPLEHRIDGRAWAAGSLDSTAVFLERLGPSKQVIDPDLATWIVVHGRVNSATTPRIVALAETVEDYQAGDQVLLVDWSEAAADPSGLTLAEDWIPDVARWFAATLADFGFSASQLRLIGHSWGSYVAAKTAELLPGTVRSLVGLDPARNGLGDWNPNAPGEIDFGRDSDFSWAFYSEQPEGGLPFVRNYGNEQTPTTADLAFVVADSSHNGVIALFANMIASPQGGVSRLFELNRLLAAAPGPWRLNQYRYDGTAGGNFEAVLQTAPGGTLPSWITFVDRTNGSTRTIYESVPENALFLVDSTDDTVDADPGDGICADAAGACTLRAAIQECNALANGPNGPDTIQFAIAGPGPHAIRPRSALPALVDPLVIDATTQADYVGAPVIELDGSLAGAGASGLTITGGGSTVRGLAINRFSRYGIEIAAGGANQILGNFLGTDLSGTLALPNNGFGIYLASANNQIGAAAPGLGNVISGNGGSGVFVGGAGSTGNVLQGNRIGTNAAGTAALANGGYGIDLRAAQTLLGGSDAAAGNVLSGNTAGGVQLSGAEAHDNQLQGNRIGTNAAGTAAIPNRGPGVTISTAANNTLGGPGQAGNLISGNGTHGVYLTGTGASGNVLAGNLIGIDLAGTALIPNAGQGVYITSGNNRVGGTGTGEGNVISGNRSSGVYLNTAAASGNQIRNNLIGTDVTGAVALGNARYGIDVRGPSNMIGGTGTDDGNVISGNGVDGVFVYTATATGNRIQGNAIGTDVSGTLDRGNRFRGIVIYAPNTTVGGVGAGGNLISGNGTHGLFIADPVSSGTVVTGNLIGTALTGQTALPNGGFGIYVAAPNNTLGGTATGAGNVISGNGGGVYLVGSGASGNTLQGNVIGLDVLGESVLGNAAFGIDVRGPNNTIGGTATGAGNLISGNRGGGVQLTSSNAHDNLLQGNWIGTDASGLQQRGNLGPGVSIALASRNTLGGTTAAARNLISGNENHGVQIAGTSTNLNVVIGNYIGTDQTGAAKLGNSRYGVYLAAANNQIGGSNSDQGNVISGNRQGGIYLAGAGSTGNTIQGNRIGTNAAGTVALGNTSVGIDLRAPQTLIGGTAAGAGNLIAGNGAAGIQVFGADARANVIQGNMIGTDGTGTADLGNAGAGLLFAAGASGNLAGGTSPGAANVIAGNHSRGITVSGATSLRNAIRQNSIFQNAGLGIDLQGDNATANDAEDADSGPNQLQNCPEMMTAVLSGDALTITYRVPSVAPHATFPLAVEFFSADVDNQEGQQFLGGESYPAAGADSVSFVVRGVSAGQRLVATATDLNGNTSEFSASVAIAAPLLAAAEAAAGVSHGETRSLVQSQPGDGQAGVWCESAGWDAQRPASLRSLVWEAPDLPRRHLGLGIPDRVVLETGAARHGRSAGFGARDNPGSGLSPWDSRSDLLSAAVQALGNWLGSSDRNGDSDSLAAVREPGTRRAPAASDVDQVLARGDWLQ